MDGLLLQLLIFAVLFAVGFGFGRYNEHKHFQYLAEQEQRLAYIQLDSSRLKSTDLPGQLVSSNVVISHDYFKYAIANVQNLLGGRLTSYESVVERARREAIVRLKLEAEKMGATQILGLRLSTTELGMQGGMVEVFAYGTAIKK
ncbi:heavy metal-binding domain-containing protein [Acinetobacter indicus]|uniref:YbjQ family protein n=1 Tax=Acinetobacter indicus TaxID=756892 RepID=UPI002576259A|nr:heavy metal-binding domain-containing protein [Acinetobacter indicus]MDM1279989.1 heavy metal-binding domain-containing protein [Acinetobacter indicus]